jgi:hypothetical protein
MHRVEEDAVWTTNQVDTSFAERVERPNADKGLLMKAPNLRIVHCVVDSWPLQEMSCVDLTKIANRSTSRGQ